MQGEVAQPNGRHPALIARANFHRNVVDFVIRRQTPLCLGVQRAKYVGRCDDTYEL